MNATVQRLGTHRARLVVSGRPYRVLTATSGPVHFVEVDGVAHRVSRDEGGVLRSPAPALVVATPVAVGAEVAAGAPVLVLESMKMETRINAPFAATVRELHVSSGSQVETGTPLLRLEPIGEAAVAPDRQRRRTRPAQHGDDGVDALADLKAVLLGFDVDPTDDGATLDRYLVERDAAAEQGADVVAGEVELLSVFADFAELSRNRPADEEARTELRVHSPREYFHSYLQSLDVDRSGLPELFSIKLRSVLAHYGITDLERTPQLEGAVFRIFLAQQRSAPDLSIVTAILQRWHVEPAPDDDRAMYIRELLDRLVLATQLRFAAVGDLARSVRFRWFDQPVVEGERAAVLAGVPAEVEYLAANPDAPDRAERMDALAAIPERIVSFLSERLQEGVLGQEPLLEVLIRRHYREYALHDLRSLQVEGRPVTVADYVLDERPTRLVSTVGTFAELAPDSSLTAAIGEQVAARAAGQQSVVDLYLDWPEAPADPDEACATLLDRCAALPFMPDARRIAVGVCCPGRPVTYFTFRPRAGGLIEDDLVRGLHPMVGRRLDLWRLRNFDVTRLDGPEDVLLYHCIAKNNEADQRLVALTQVRELAVVRDDDDRVVSLPQVERAIANCVEGIRRARALHALARRGPRHESRVGAHLAADRGRTRSVDRAAPPHRADHSGCRHRRGARAGTRHDAGRRRSSRSPDGSTTSPVPACSSPSARRRPSGCGRWTTTRRRSCGPVGAARSTRTRSTEWSRATGGSVVEHDMDDAGRLVPVDRPAGLNKAGIVVALVTTPTTSHPDGITRVLLSGDPTRALGALSEPECSRVIAALDLAESMGVPIEWYALSAGARIAMNSGTENMDWVARALKRIVEFTQAGGEINIVVAGINVGAQPYWNAEATMLMHTKGILVMTPDSAMVLTGKQSLDFSGGVSAEDNFGIGGYDRVMGPNGQAQYWAPDLKSARDIVLAHYEHAYVAPGESGPRRAPTTDPSDRDITSAPHVLLDSDFTTVGDIFSVAANPDRKKAFDIRTVMHALADQDHPLLERWAGMADADTAVVCDAHLGGHPVCLLGIESRNVPRRGYPPTDGPDTYTAGTLFPRSSKKAARAINAASGNRPLVVLANLSGFDGSPDSMRNLQLEYGAEIGRAVVNFAGPIVFCVISRYHGGAFVVFSKALNPSMTVLAVEGSFASVIGGAPAAAVVFAAEVDRRTDADARVRELQQSLRSAGEAARAPIAASLRDVRTAVRAEKLGEVAAEFDGIHSIHRAVEVGSVDAVISPHELRPRIIEVLERS